MAGRLNISYSQGSLSFNVQISQEVMAIYIWVVYSVFCQIINAFGVVTNIINIICFVKQGFEDSINISLLGLAVSDLGSLMTMMWSCISITPAFSNSDLPFDPYEVVYVSTGMMHFSFTRVSSYITAMITIERCLCITAPFKIKHIITPQRSALMTLCLFIIFFCSGAPVFAVIRLDKIFSPLRNKTLIGLVSTGDRENVEKITFVNNFCIPVGAFVIIATCTAIISIKLRSTAHWRKNVITNSQSEKSFNRNIKTSKMVVMISILFIVCFIPVSIIVLAVGFISELSVNGKYMYISMIIAGIGYTMESINSSMNVFIYYHMSSKFRDNFMLTFQRGRKRRQSIKRM